MLATASWSELNVHERAFEVVEALVNVKVGEMQWSQKFFKDEGAKGGAKAWKDLTPEERSAEISAFTVLLVRVLFALVLIYIGFCGQRRVHP